MGINTLEVVVIVHRSGQYRSMSGSVPTCLARGVSRDSRSWEG
jgi:hypothetical protein